MEVYVIGAPPPTLVCLVPLAAGSSAQSLVVFQHCESYWQLFVQIRHATW